MALRDKKLSIKDAKGILGSNLEETDKMQKLVDYLLTLSSYEKSKKNLIKVSVNLSKVVKKVLEKYKAFATQKGIRFFSNLKETKVKIDEVSIEQLVSILVDNAIKYSPVNKSISINLKTQRRNALLEITDEGMGI